MNHPVPSGWRFPNRVHVHNMWDLWFFGHMGNGIRPYRFINRYQDVLLNKDKKLVTAAKGVMDALTKIIVESEPPLLVGGVQALKKLDQLTSDRILPRAIRLLVEKLLISLPKLLMLALISS